MFFDNNYNMTSAPSRNVLAIDIKNVSSFKTKSDYGAFAIQSNIIK